MGGIRRVPLVKRPLRVGSLVRDASGIVGTVVRIERRLWAGQEFHEAIYVAWNVPGVG